MSRMSADAHLEVAWEEILRRKPDPIDTVNSRGSVLQNPVRNVGGVDLPSHGAVKTCIFFQGNGNGVGFLSGRAGRAPHFELDPAGDQTWGKLWEDDIAQVIQMGRFAEEMSVIGRYEVH